MKIPFKDYQVGDIIECFIPEISFHGVRIIAEVLQYDFEDNSLYIEFLAEFGYIRRGHRHWIWGTGYGSSEVTLLHRPADKSERDFFISLHPDL